MESSKIVRDFKGKKKDEFTCKYLGYLEELNLGMHVLSYKYMYNKFVEISGGCNIKEWALECSLSSATASTFREEQGSRINDRTYDKMMAETSTDPFQSTPCKEDEERFGVKVEDRVEEKVEEEKAEGKNVEDNAEEKEQGTGVK